MFSIGTPPEVKAKVSEEGKEQIERSSAVEQAWDALFDQWSLCHGELEWPPRGKPTSSVNQSIGEKVPSTLADPRLDKSVECCRCRVRAARLGRKRSGSCGRGIDSWRPYE